MRVTPVSAVLAAVMAVCSACGSPAAPAAAGRQQAAAPYKIEPVTLKVFNGLFNDQDWQTIVAEPLKRKFPQITLEPLTGKIEDLVTAGQVPDLLLNPVSSIANFMALDLPLDVTELYADRSRRLDRGRAQEVVVRTRDACSPSIYQFPGGGI